MLNPILTNSYMSFSENFFPEVLTKKYDSYFQLKNSPISDIKMCILESIKDFSIPGISDNTIKIENINNTRGRLPTDFEHTISRNFISTNSIDNILTSNTFVFTVRNNITNWLYYLDYFYSYFRRDRITELFDIYIEVKDAAEIPMFQVLIGDCFISGLPEMQFTQSTMSFNETKEFDVTTTFNSFEIRMLLPSFDMEIIKLI